MNSNDFLLELGTEELPPKLLQQLSEALSNNLIAQFNALNLAHTKVEIFATPRRLAVLVHDLQGQQNDLVVERKGPNVNAPEQAITGFAKSCGVRKENLAQKPFGKADYYYFSKTQKGLKTKDLLENVVATAIKKIPITRPMRWGDLSFSFVRPVHWLVMMLDTEVVDASIMGLNSSNITHGLRFAEVTEFSINKAKDYQKILLNQAKIEVSFDIRKATIRTQIEQVANKHQAHAVIDEALLDEVCALVEHPQTFSGKFDKRFLNVPEEALISAMKKHQKYFHMVDDEHKLLPAFITVANTQATDLSAIINGNERVIHPRLSDAEFFWEQDKSATLESRLDKLSSVLFMDGLGSMADKAKRIETLAGYIANIIDADTTHSARAGLLCKTDLVTDMVGEFADLQGVMGGYYALNDGEDEVVATAISEHYHPRFSGDSLPSSKEGLCVAIADKVDSIVGIYGIGHKPTGSKDPYALKRAGLGLLRMMIESGLKISLRELVVQSATSAKLKGLYEFDNRIAIEVYDFIVSRLSAYYQEKSIDKGVVKAVLAVRQNHETANNSVHDWHLRITILNDFMQDERAQSFVEVDKRIKNILKDADPQEYNGIPNADVTGLTSFDDALYRAFRQADNKWAQRSDYQKIITELLELKPVIDDFFDNVMVNDKDEILRACRLQLLNMVRTSFLSIADFSYLSK